MRSKKNLMKYLWFHIKAIINKKKKINIPPPQSVSNITRCFTGFNRTVENLKIHQLQTPPKRSWSTNITNAFHLYIFFYLYCHFFLADRIWTRSDKSWSLRARRMRNRYWTSKITYCKYSRRPATSWKTRTRLTFWTIQRLVLVPPSKAAPQTLSFYPVFT